MERGILAYPPAQRKGGRVGMKWVSLKRHKGGLKGDPFKYYYMH